MAQTKAHMDATNRFNKKAYDRIQISVRKDADLNGDVIRTHAESRGESVNSFIIRAIAETIKRDNSPAE